MSGCDKCDGFGSAKTYANQVCMVINGKERSIDWCIHKIVSALNAGGVETVACCCGHGIINGRIDLADGRVLTIANSYLENDKNRLCGRHKHRVALFCEECMDEFRSELIKDAIRNGDGKP